MCTGPESETPNKQATITAVRQNISLGGKGVEKRVFIIFSSLREQLSAFSLQIVRIE